MELLNETLLRLSRYALPLLALWLLTRCVRSMLREGYEPEAWAWLETSSGETALIRHWECLIGRAKSCDVVVDRKSVSRTHAALMRNGRGFWKLYDLGSAEGSAVGNTPDTGKGTELYDGDTVRFADVEMVFHGMNEQQRSAVDRERSIPGIFISPGITLLILTVFQVLLLLELASSLAEDSLFLTAVLGFAALILIEWGDYFFMRAMDRSGFEPETLAFFLSTLGVAVVSSSAPETMGKQVALLAAGVLLFLLLGWWLRDISRTRIMRWPVAVLALALLAVNLVAGETTYGATNWLTIGGFTLQPSEFVKVAYVYAGAATLDRLFRRRNLFGFIAFSAACVGALALMGDFGTALVFFVSFLVISFMRSGSFATVFLAVAGAALGVMLVLMVKPYVAQRFSTWGHVWDDPLGAGWQQAQALSAAASGGLLGVGAGRGYLKNIFAADMDLIFCLMCEELGLVIAFCAMLALVALGFFAVRSAARGRSSFYVIAACAASSMLLVQLSLHVFGSVDLVPFTGVTFPFVSRGGSSLIACWGLLAFLKAADTRQRASFSVKLSSPDSGEEEDEF